MPSASKRLADFMASKGRKLTHQMEKAADAILAQSSTFTHDDAIEAARGKASRPTVHRVLSRMLEAGIIRKVRFNDRDVFVEVASEDEAR